MTRRDQGIEAKTDKLDQEPLPFPKMGLFLFPKDPEVVVMMTNSAFPVYIPIPSSPTITPLLDLDPGPRTSVTLCAVSARCRVFKLHIYTRPSLPLSLLDSPVLLFSSLLLRQERDGKKGGIRRVIYIRHPQYALALTPGTEEMEM